MRTILTFCFLISATPALSKDFGTIGPVWPVIEPNILETIKARLQEMEGNGEMERMKTEMQDTTKAYVNRPRPVPGIGKAVEEREYDVDLSITVTRPLTDHNGRVFAEAGTVVNPLAYSKFNKRIVVIDGDDPMQVDFALSEGNELDTLLVLVKGSPLDLTKEHGRRFYFDQDGQIANRFLIQNVPAEITRGKTTMVVREVPVQ